ncbi:MAG: glycosyltransferase [Pseudorhodoplanes sp.]|jgi:glycosyltransferase involved in cell wall biosynthesis|nr:glycosyltransferase [Pseudorhodoplanes sp.]
MFVLLVPSLEFGGTERQVTLLAHQLHNSGQPVIVATFREGGAFSSQLAAKGVDVVALAPGSSNPLVLASALRKLVQTRSARAVYSYLPAANVVASIATIGLKDTRVVWSVRSADMPLRGYGLKTRFAYALERILSGLPHQIVTNSRAGRAASVRKGFPEDKLLVIENGFDTDLFRPDGAARARLRAEFGLQDHHLLIGLIGRLDPVKGHETFLHAARLFSDKHADARFICVGGTGPADHVARLHALARNLNLGGRLIWTGDRSDVPEVLNAVDIANLCSTSEGFPNIVGEAMACGIPCVVSDVGDAAHIVGETGIVVPAGDADALRAAWERLAEPTERARLSRLARERMVRHFGLDRMADQTVKVLTSFK